MIEALLLLLAHRQAAMPADYKGVWANATGQTLIINSTHSVQGMLGERHLAGHYIYQVPDGSYLGSWRASRTVRRGDRYLPLEWASFYGNSVPSNFEYPLPDLPSVPAESGEIRLQEKFRSNAGKLVSLRIRLRTADDQTKFDDEFYRVMNSDSISFNGEFNDSSISVAIEDLGERSAILRGEITFEGAKYILQGVRVEARGSFEMIDTSNGVVRGLGYIEWTPTLKRVREIQDHKTLRTDQLTVGLMTDLSAGHYLNDHVLVRKSP
jgi:hypothetical protein